jgi:NhaP-type Na+/H+ or K+/H+ antiporter
MLLVSLAYDFILYAQLTLWDTTVLMVDIITSAIIGALVGAAVGWYNGRK